MNFEYIIETYGYWAVLVGTLLEGETILILGGFAAHQGYLELQWVILAAFGGACAGDQFFFFLGRKYSGKVLARVPSWNARILKVQKLLNRFHTWLIFMYRFTYGFRSVTPFVLGTSAVPALRFVPLNMLAVALWATVIGILGYVFGGVLQGALGNLKKYELRILAAIGATVFCVWLVKVLSHRNSRRRP